jgi:hypothetical protein
MEYSTIQSAILSGTTVRQILTELASMNPEIRTVTQINIVQERVADIILVLINAQEDLIELISENRELRRQLEAKRRDTNVAPTARG